MALNIPRHITLPFGYKVIVLHVPYQELLLKGSDSGGHWDVETRTIFLDEDLSLKEQRYYLLSNLFHACLDCQHNFLDNGLASLDAVPEHKAD